MDLKEVVGWNAENLDQRIMNRLRHFPEAGVVILTFEHADFRERHVLLSLSKATPRRRGWFLLNTVVRTVPIPSVSLVATPRWAGPAQCGSKDGRLIGEVRFGQSLRRRRFRFR